MEALGLSDLSEAERLVIAAIGILQEKLGASEFVPSKEIIQQELCINMSAPTFYNALSELLRRKTIEVPLGRKKGVISSLLNLQASMEAYLFLIPNNV